MWDAKQDAWVGDIASARQPPYNQTPCDAEPTFAPNIAHIPGFEVASRKPVIRDGYRPTIV